MELANPLIDESLRKRHVRADRKFDGPGGSHQVSPLSRAFVEDFTVIRVPWGDLRIGRILCGSWLGLTIRDRFVLGHRESAAPPTDRHRYRQ